MTQWIHIARFLFLPAVMLLGHAVSGQDIGVGEWRAHVPYQRALDVAVAPDKVYCAAENGIFIYNKADNSIETLTKVNGLSDVGITTIEYSKKRGVLFIGYANGNIDLLEGNEITSISSIKYSSIIGSKSINSVNFQEDIAWLSCAFGVVVFDFVNRNILETYTIKEDGSQINANAIAFDKDKIFVATDDGIYEASKDHPNLLDFNAWSKHQNLAAPDSSYNLIFNFNGTIYANFKGSEYNSDTLYHYNGNSWNRNDSLISLGNNSAKVLGNRILMAHNESVDMYNDNWKVLHHLFSYQSGEHAFPVAADMDSDSVIWVADRMQGMIKSIDPWNNEVITPEGPFSGRAYSVSVSNGEVWVASGGRTVSWGYSYLRDGIFQLKEGEWSHINKYNTPALVDSMWDFLAVMPDPNDPERVFTGAFSGGFFEFYKNKLVKIHNDSLRITDMVFDEDNNLWMTNFGSIYSIVVKKPDGKFIPFDFSGFLNKKRIDNIIIDQRGYKWAVIPRGQGQGILVLDDNGTLGNPDDDRVAILEHANGKGNLPGDQTFSIVEDLDGEIWIGTNEGIGVIFSPGNVFDGGDYDAETIKIKQDGSTQLLLETEQVNGITLDAANRKWISTQKGGVFLMSADGTEEILHFTKENSPLFSNVINSIAINHDNGEVFISTDKGLLSYKSTATKGQADFIDVYAYPNPVRPGYEGLVAIKGLVTNANVKITDITGNLVYETYADGGQAVWNGKNFTGEKVKSGVYLVFCSDEEGSRTFVTKILFLN